MKTTKKITAVILAAVLMFTVCIPVFAETPEEYEKTPYKYGKGVSIDTETPVIYIPGVFNTNLVSADGTSLMFPTFTGDDILNLVKKLMQLEDTQDYDGFVDSLIAQMHSWVDGIECDSSGIPIDKSVKLEHFWDYPTPAEEPMAKGLAAQLGNDKVWVFTYDWRYDIRETVVNELRPYVEYVKEYTGSDKVSLFFMSMGGALGNVYLEEFGDCGDLENVVIDSGALGGVSIVNDIMSDEKLYIDRQSLVEFVESAEDGVIDEIGTVSGIASAISGYVVDKLNVCLERRSTELKNAIMSVVGKCPGIWELGKSNGMSENIKKYLDPVEDKVLIDKINYYYETYQNRAGEIIKTMNDKDYANVRLICHYNCKRVPVTESVKTLQTDFLIDTAYESLGATVLNLYETFPENYKVAKGDNQGYLSPDYMIDASTCADPDHTWFVKNAVHCCNGDVGSQLKKFAVWLALAEGDVDINTNSDYPQYLIALSGFRLMTLQDYLDQFNIDEAAGEEDGKYVSSKITTYTYYTLTLPAWLCLAALAVLLIVLIVKKSGNKEEIEGVLTKQELKNLPKAERKAAKKNNKVLIKQHKRDKKSAKKAHKAELKAMPKSERKAAKKADKAQKKANKKQTKANFKARKKQAKLDKKEAKAAKKAGKTPEEETTES